MEIFLKGEITEFQVVVILLEIGSTLKGEFYSVLNKFLF